jgi:hypothetical protein
MLKMLGRKDIGHEYRDRGIDSAGNLIRRISYAGLPRMGERSIRLA